MPSFTRIYFDTSVLIAANWPKLSATLENLLSLAQSLKVTVFVPEAVEEELEAHWNRLFDEKYAKAKNSFADLIRHASTKDRKFDDITVVNKDGALASYRENVKLVKEQWKLKTVPLTLRPTGELFHKAIYDEPPFQKRDVGFQDTVIYLSVVDHLREDPSRVGAFISQDGIFSDAKILDNARAAGVRIEVYASVDEVYKELDNRLEAALKRAWDADRTRAEDVLADMLSEIQKFVSENIEISENDLGFGVKILAVRNLEAKRVRNVQTPFLLDRKENEPVRISFEIEMSLSLEVEGLYIPRTPSRLKVGRDTRQSEMRSFEEMFIEPFPQERIVPWLAEAEATVAPDDKDYRSIQFLSVRSKGPNVTVMIERALATTPSK